MADFLVNVGVNNALNMPSLSAEEAPKLKPYMALAEQLGSLVGQLSGEGLMAVSVEVEGAAAELNQKPITGAVLAGLMKVYSDTEMGFWRSEEHTSELQSLMRISYAVFCLKKKKQIQNTSI